MKVESLADVKKSLKFVLSVLEDDNLDTDSPKKIKELFL